MRLRRPSRTFFLFALVERGMMVWVLSTITQARAFGQIDRAVLEGTVTDQSGAAIGGASVKILSVDTAITQEQRTNAHGYYHAPGLAVGRYTLTVTSAGFKTKIIEDVILQVGQTRTLDAQLRVGTISQTIDVQASAAPSDRSSAETSTVIDTTQIANLPVNGRDSASLPSRAH